MVGVMVVGAVWSRISRVKVLGRMLAVRGGELPLNSAGLLEEGVAGCGGRVAWGGSDIGCVGWAE